MNFEKLTGLGIGSWGLGEDPKKKKDEIAAIRYGLDHGTVKSSCISAVSKLDTPQ